MGFQLAVFAPGLARPCLRKQQCETRGQAEAQMRSILRRGLEKDRNTIHVYQCPHCHYWHVGHDRSVTGAVTTADRLPC